MESKSQQVNQEFTESQKGALAIIRRTVNTLYLEWGSDVIDKYISDEQEINQCYALAKDERVAALPYFFRNITRTMAFRYSSGSVSKSFE